MLLYTNTNLVLVYTSSSYKIKLILIITHAHVTVTIDNRDTLWSMLLATIDIRDYQRAQLGNQDCYNNIIIQNLNTVAMHIHA